MAANPAEYSTSSLSLLDWNIYGLHRAHLKERTQYICDYILAHSPTIVFLQEVVPLTWPMITNSLSGQYHCYSGIPRAHYFNGLLVIKSPNVSVLSDSVEYLSFPTSTMGRYLIGITISFNGHKIYFMTSHIESLDAPNNVTERKKQLKLAFDKMVEVCSNKSQSLSCVFGGDLNTRDSEIAEINPSKCIADIWEVCGSKSNEKMTWNTHLPVSRCDRIYLYPSDDNSSSPIQPVEFKLLGGEQLQGLGCYPSDHFGVWVKFCVRK